RHTRTVRAHNARRLPVPHALDCTETHWSRLVSQNDSAKVIWFSLPNCWNKGCYPNSHLGEGAKRMAKSHLKVVEPSTVIRTVTPTRLPNADLRTREYLTEAEVERLTAAARKNRWGHRDGTMILVAYRHGLRVSELVDLRWEQIEFASPLQSKWNAHLA